MLVGARDRGPAMTVAGCGGRWVPGVVRWVGTREGGIPGTTQPGQIEAYLSIYWYCQGPTIARGLFLRPPGTPGPCQGLPHTWLLALSILAIRARFNLKYLKVSQNGRVSPKMSNEAWHTPCLKKRLISHDLEFLRKGHWPAFSHKE